MNERERFEECIWKRYLKVCEQEKWDMENKDNVFEYKDNGYCRETIQNYWICWQARDEIAQQDEKGLIEALIEVIKWRALDGDGITDPLRSEIINIIEKHTGKTREEINGTYTEK